MVSFMESEYPAHFMESVTAMEYRIKAMFESGLMPMGSCGCFRAQSTMDRVHPPCSARSCMKHWVARFHPAEW